MVISRWQLGLAILTLTASVHAGTITYQDSVTWSLPISQSLGYTPSPPTNPESVFAETVLGTAQDQQVNGVAVPFAGEMISAVTPNAVSNFIVNSFSNSADTFLYSGTASGNTTSPAGTFSLSSNSFFSRGFTTPSGALAGDVIQLPALNCTFEIPTLSGQNITQSSSCSGGSNIGEANGDFTFFSENVSLSGDGNLILAGQQLSLSCQTCALNFSIGTQTFISGTATIVVPISLKISAIGGIITSVSSNVALPGIPSVGAPSNFVSSLAGLSYPTLAAPADASFFQISFNENTTQSATTPIPEPTVLLPVAFAIALMLLMKSGCRSGLLTGIRQISDSSGMVPREP